MKSKQNRRKPMPSLLRWLSSSYFGNICFKNQLVHLKWNIPLNISHFLFLVSVWLYSLSLGGFNFYFWFSIWHIALLQRAGLLLCDYLCLQLGAGGYLSSRFYHAWPPKMVGTYRFVYLLTYLLVSVHQYPKWISRGQLSMNPQCFMHTHPCFYSTNQSALGQLEFVE